MLAGELARARSGLFYGRRGHAVVRWLDGQEAEWTGPGTVALDDRRLVLDGEYRRHASLRTVERVWRHRRYVWVQRVRAHGWLIRCATGADADRLTVMLREAVEVVQRS